MNDSQRLYLIAAYALAKDDPMHAFFEDDIANYVGLDPNEPGYADRFFALTRFHIETGNVRSVSKTAGGGRRRLELTAAGFKEGERLSDPIELKKEGRRRFLRAVYDLADGDPAEFVGWEDVAPVMGWDASNHEHLDECIALAEYAERAGLIVIEVNEGTVYRITAKGVDQVEGNDQQPTTGPTITIHGDVMNSMLGTNTNSELKNTFDFRSVERQIERDGGEDKEELKRALAKVERLIERGEYLDRGALSEFSGTMERHSWFTGAVAQALIGFATQAMGG